MFLMETAIAKVVAVFRQFPERDDNEVLETLIGGGMDPNLAARMVEFVPMAYCRFVLDGVKFPDTFERQREDGSRTPPRLFRSEPVWNAALDFARSEIQQGLSLDDKLRVAG